MFESDKIKPLREGLGLNVKEFAKLVGTTERSVTRWESGMEDKTIPGTAGEVLAALYQALAKWPNKMPRFVKETVAIGGLAYFMTRLLDNLISPS